MNKVILLTGASSGLGAAMALALDRAGARMAIAARRTARLQALAKQMHEPLVLTADLSREEDAREIVRATINLFGRLDVLINNAASIIVDHSEKVTQADMITAFRTNLVAPMISTQEALVQMRKQGRGHIINVGSPGFMVGVPFYAPYAATKGALTGWTRTLQAEWAGSDIMVSEFFPGYCRVDSPPDSRIGPVEQDFIMAEKQPFLSRFFTRPATPEKIAKLMVGLVEKPRPLVYSGFEVHLGAFIANLTGIRIRIGHQMAVNGRSKMAKWRGSEIAK